jgi:phosphopantetheine adenylyltransferase
MTAAVNLAIAECDELHVVEIDSPQNTNRFNDVIQTSKSRRNELRGRVSAAVARAGKKPNCVTYHYHDTLEEAVGAGHTYPFDVLYVLETDMPRQCVVDYVSQLNAARVDSGMTAATVRQIPAVVDANGVTLSSTRQRKREVLPQLRASRELRVAEGDNK